MSLATANTRQTSRDFSRYFDFLTKEFGLQMSMEKYSITGADLYVRILSNKFVQVELAGDQHYFHAEIRRLIDGETRPYTEEENNIGFEDLAVLTTDNKYNHSDFYPASAGCITVLENTAALFRNSAQVFTTGSWVDTRRIAELKDEEIFQKFGFKPSENKNKPSFFLLVRQHVQKLVGKGYMIVLDNANLPPYSPESVSHKIVLEGFDRKIEIAQKDWRLDYTTYYIAVNNEIIFEKDIAVCESIEAAAAEFIENIERIG